MKCQLNGGKPHRSKPDAGKFMYANLTVADLSGANLKNAETVMQILVVLI
jgi:uncharacterized protein YjbI with pentapeptide repeats